MFVTECLHNRCLNCQPCVQFIFSPRCESDMILSVMTFKKKFFTYQGSLCAIQHTYICVCLSQTVRLMSFLNFLLFKEACVPCRTPIIVSLSLTIRSTYFHFFLLQGSLYAVWHTYNCVCITDSQTDIFLKFFTFQGSLCAIQNTYYCVSITDNQSNIFPFFSFCNEACMLYGIPTTMCVSQTFRLTF